MKKLILVIMMVFCGNIMAIDDVILDPERTVASQITDMVNEINERKIKINYDRLATLVIDCNKNIIRLRAEHAANQDEEASVDDIYYYKKAVVAAIIYMNIVHGKIRNNKKYNDWFKDGEEPSFDVGYNLIYTECIINAYTSNRIITIFSEKDLLSYLAYIGSEDNLSIQMGRDRLSTELAVTECFTELFPEDL